MDGDKQEHIKDAAKVISKYSDIIALRNSALITSSKTAKPISYEEYIKDEAIQELAEHSEKPVINMESNLYHPCQSMADMMTMYEKFGKVEKKKYVLTWAPHPKPLPLATPNSQLITPSIFDMDVTLVCPEGYELDPGVKVKVVHDQKEAFKDADIIVAKSWASPKFFNNWKKEKEYRKSLPNWMVDEEKMNLTNNAYFMHCLPIRRNVVASDAVLDSVQSLIIQEAENRMWSQMAIISYLLTQNS